MATIPPAHASEQDSAPRFDPARVAWTSLDFEASRFFITATASIQVGMRTAADVAGQLISTPAGKPVDPGASVLELHYRAGGLGRDADMTLWLRPDNGAALQYQQLLSGGKARYLVVRFADTGVYERNRRPVSPQEQSLPNEQWSNRGEDKTDYPAAAHDEAVIEPISLLWLISAADLRAAGDRMTVLAFQRHDVYRVTAEVTGMQSTRVSYREKRPAGEVNHQGKVQALHIHIRGINVDPNRTNSFELLGLQGEMDLLLDPQSRAPLELGGRAKIVGQIAMHLRSATLAR